MEEKVKKLRRHLLDVFDKEYYNTKGELIKAKQLHSYNDVIDLMYYNEFIKHD